MISRNPSKNIRREVTVEERNSDKKQRRNQGAGWRIILPFLLLVIVLFFRPNAHSKTPTSLMVERHFVKTDLMEIPSSKLLCGAPWTTTFRNLLEGGRKNKPLLWTVSGGDQYISNMKMILSKWKSLGLYPALVVALDEATARHACSLGHHATHWDVPRASYSVVADAKFQIATFLAQHNIPGLFLELDIFCRSSPLPAILSALTNQPSTELVVLGHGDVNFKPNIGMYYVRPTPIMANFFRSVSHVLSHSLTKNYYYNQDGLPKEYFDQTVFYHCLPKNDPDDIHSHAYRGIFKVEDKNRTKNMLDLCRNATTPSFRFKVLSHTFVNSLHPPVVYDDTRCIHPLSTAPFSSFALKIATAKFLGFDPKPILPSDRFLKTISGDLVFGECWRYMIYRHDFPKSSEQRESVETQIATLVWLAKTTGRTLVLPRYARDTDAFAVLVMSIVDISTIEALVPYRFLSPEDKAQLASQTVIETLPHRNIRTTADQIKSLPNEQIVAVDGFCRLLWDRMPHPEIMYIKSQLRFCINANTALDFSKSFGWSKLCGSNH